MFNMQVSTLPPKFFLLQLVILAETRPGHRETREHRIDGVSRSSPKLLGREMLGSKN